jgi:DNA polymerase (family 10)
VPSSPLLHTIQELTAIARVRGDEHEAEVLERASTLVANLSIASEQDLGPLLAREHHGIAADAAVEARLRQMHTEGSWVVLEWAIADLPADLRWLFETKAISLHQLADLHVWSGATSIADLADLVRNGAISRLPGFDAEVEHAIGKALPTLRDSRKRMALGRAWSIADPVLTLLRGLPSVTWAEPAGSIRRGQETVGDIELVAASDAPDAVFDAVLAGTDGARRLHRSADRLYVFGEGAQIGIRCAPPERAGATLLHLTGSHAHVDELHARARKRGWHLNPQGLDRGAGAPPLGRTEEEIYEALNLQWVPAEVRNGQDELRRAEAGTIPTLLRRSDIKGDLHMHTTYSDGRDSTEAMVAACLELGYEYMAITDHSAGSSATRNLTVDGITRQADEIATLKERHPQITILHGCEVDILPDGTLDFPDRLLEQFDVVLASLHDRADHEPVQLLRRYLAAMRHPLVNVITHPTNRFVPGRPGYDLDYMALFAAAVETGTVMEIDGGPSHLDLDGALAHQAVLAGAMLVVDSDSHRDDVLGRQMEFGVKTARRGWVEPRHVLNTRPLGQLQRFLSEKRARG